MRKSQRILSIAITAATLQVLVGSAQAIDYTWNVPAGGSQPWDSAASWTTVDPLGTFPTLSGDKADLSVALAADLTTTFATNQTISTLVLGGTAGPVVTTVGDAAGGALIFAGTTGLQSKGVTGSTNTIAAPTVLQADLNFDAASTNAIAFATNIQMDGGNRKITNNAPGAVLKLGTSATSEIRLYDYTTPATARTLTLSGNSNSVTEINGTFSKGPSNVGSYAFDATNSTALAQSTFIVNAPQTFGSSLQRSTYILNDNLALGPGTMTAAGAGTLTATGVITASNGNQANWSGIISTTKPGGVTLPNLIIMGNSLAFAGSENIVLSGADDGQQPCDGQCDRRRKEPNVHARPGDESDGHLHRHLARRRRWHANLDR
ncbi:MAG: hypothetical protein QM770_15680 [Tepidisphaeraceae bacterium]